MNVPFYIAKKQGFQQRNAYTASIVRIGIIATALSVAVMIIAFSFINGFKHTVKEKVTQFWGDFTIADFGLKPQANLVADAIYKDARIEHVLHENKNVDAYFPYILRPAILHANQLMEGIQLKGVDASFHWPTTMQYSGEALSKIDSSSVNAIVLSSTTANRLRLQKGSDLFVYFLQKESNVPKIRKLKVVGLYHTGMEELDKHFAFCQLSLLQKVNQWNAQQISGYQVHVVDPLQATSIANSLQQQYLQAPVVATTTSDLYASIFDWLHLQDMNARIIYIIMILVAMINLSVAVLILIVDQSKTIGVLQSLGMRFWEIQKIYLWHGFKIATWGVGIGTLLALGICAAQLQFGFLKLNEATYYMAEVPVKLAFLPIVCIDAATILLCAICTLLPGLYIRTLQVTKLIQFK